MTNLQKMINVAIAEMLNTVSTNVNSISKESATIIKIALETYRQKLEDSENRCKYCVTGVYYDEYGRSVIGYSYCPKCGCKLKKRE